jgi:hypothetical protein
MIATTYGKMMEICEMLPERQGGFLISRTEQEFVDKQFAKG